MLDGLIRKQQFASNRCYFSIVIQHLNKRFQPAGLNFGIVIQKQHIFSKRCFGPLIACLGKTKVFAIRNDFNFLFK